MTARELYDRDSTFKGLIDFWVQEKQPPAPLLDYLMEVGLDGQAEAVRWALSVEKRPGYGPRSRELLVYPCLLSGGIGWVWDHWSGESHNSLPTSRHLYWVDKLSSDPYYSSFTSPTQAILALLDGWADYLEEERVLAGGN